MQANMHVEACSFDANSHHGPGGMNFLHFARRAPSEMKISKIRWTVVLGRPSGMCGGCGRGYGEGRRSAKSKKCNFVIVYLSTCASDSTRQLLSTTRAADRYAHTAGPL